jgi:putative transposase
MKTNCLSCKRRKRRVITTKVDKSKLPAPNLIKQEFEADRPNEKWCSDIIYGPTAEGWLFLVVILDLYSRKVVGWAMDKTMTTGLVCDAYQMALTQRRPAAGLIHHSDRGSQYTSHEFQKLLVKNKALASMSGKGNCYDNAVSESFFGTLKTELVPKSGYQKRAIGRSGIFAYIEGFYNRSRLHSSIGYCSPDEFEAIYWKNQATNSMTSSRVH